MIFNFIKFFFFFLIIKLDLTINFNKIVEKIIITFIYSNEKINFPHNKLRIKKSLKR